jgi:hypothetical protein
MAWIIVDIGERAWCQLAYQFGHELGHVLANSWQPHARPKPPCQWLEEALVEAFSLRGLGRLAKSWKQDPPFPGNNKYGNKIAEYRRNIVKRYTKLAAEQGLVSDPAAWFANHRKGIEVAGLNPFAQAASLTILKEYERVPECVASLGALNRWPGRSGVRIEDYLRQWEASCVELEAAPVLPVRLQEIRQGRCTAGTKRGAKWASTAGTSKSSGPRVAAKSGLHRVGRRRLPRTARDREVGHEPKVDQGRRAGVR